MIHKLRTLVTDESKKNFFIYGVGQAFNLLSPLVVAPYIVSVCREEGFGKSALGFAMALFLILIVDYAFDVKGTKIASENRHNPDALHQLLTTTIFTKMVLFCITFVVASVLIFTVPFLYEERLLFFMSLPIVFAQVFVPVWFLQGIEAFPMVSALNIGSKTAYVILVYTLVNHESDYIWVNFFLGASALVFNLIGLFMIMRKYRFTIRRPSFSHIKTILREDLMFCISQLFLSVRQLSALFLAGYFLGYHIAGQYKIIEQSITFFRTFMQVFLKFFYPKACFKMAGSIKSGIAFWKKYSLANVGLVSIGLGVIYFFSADVLRFFNAGEDSITYLNPLFRLSLLISLFMSFTLPLEQLMFITEKNKAYIRITIFVTVVTVAMLLTLIRTYTLSGIIAALIIPEIIFIVLYLYHVYGFLDKRKL